MQIPWRLDSLHSGHTAAQIVFGDGPDRVRLANFPIPNELGSLHASRTKLCARFVKLFLALDRRCRRVGRLFAFEEWALALIDIPTVAKHDFSVTTLLNVIATSSSFAS